MLWRSWRRLTPRSIWMVTTISGLSSQTTCLEAGASGASTIYSTLWTTVSARTFSTWLRSTSKIRWSSMIGNSTSDNGCSFRTSTLPKSGSTNNATSDSAPSSTVWRTSTTDTSTWRTTPSRSITINLGSRLKYPATCGPWLSFPNTLVKTSGR